MRFGDGKMEWHFEVGTDPLIDGSSLTFGDFANLAVDVPFEVGGTLRLLPVDRTRFCSYAAAIYLRQGEPPV